LGRRRGLIAFAGVGIPTAAVAGVAVWLGAAAVGAVVALLVVVAGVLLALSPAPVEVERSMILEELERGEPRSRAQVRREARRSSLQIGVAVALAGAIGLAIALPAL
jgi:hypothetical protein